MLRSILPLLALIFIPLLSSCTNSSTAESTVSASPPTTAALAGKWKSERGFFILFDEQNGTFSGSNHEDAADAGLGILGTFSLADDQLRLVENDDSASCPGVEGIFDIAMSNDGKLRLTIVEDACIYRVEGLFQGGQGGYRLLEFQRVRE